MSNIFDDLAGPGEPRDPTETARIAARGELPKRFYKSATVAAADDGFRVLLDGRPVRTPARAVLAVPSEAVATALAEEWNAQGATINPMTMSLTRLVNVAIDGVVSAADEIRDEIARYAGSDLLAYRAEGPERLAARQTALWDPVVAHAERRLGVRVALAEGVMPVAQDARLVQGVRDLLPADPFVLAGLHVITTLTGSALLALAVLDGRISADDAFDAANVDEDWNIELWGEDAEAMHRRALRRKEMEAAALLVVSANV
jgi:chaperone required for assembly of F1-ATPase